MVSDPDEEAEGNAPHRDLLARRDAPGLARLGFQTALLLGSAAATLQLGASNHAAVWIAIPVCGLAIAGFFPILHETGHETAFRTSLLNRIGVWTGAVLMLQVPTYFREYHWEHHRATQDRDRDPEINMLPKLLDDWPRNPLAYLAIAGGQALMLGKLAITLTCALGPAAIARLFPYVRATRRSALAWESRGFATGLVGLTALGAFSAPGAAYLLLAWPVAHLFLGLYLMPEHTGLPNQGSQFDRTRTVRSNAPLRWFMWNMPYHTEHHARPAVPFHALPELHRRLGPQLVNVSSGYAAFHREALRRAFRVPGKSS